jgi:hypothetical protein
MAQQGTPKSLQESTKNTGKSKLKKKKKTPTFPELWKGYLGCLKTPSFGEIVHLVAF